MMWTKRIITLVSPLLLGLLFFSLGAAARVERPITLTFNPQEDEFNRYMTVITVVGAITRPGEKTDIEASNFRIRAVYRDLVQESLHGLNRHLISFYDYDVWAPTPTRGRRERFGGRGGLGGGGGGASAGGAEPPPVNPPTAGGSTSPGSGSLMQTPGGPSGPGGPRGPRQPPDFPGEVDPTFSVDKILITDLSYTESKNGDVLDIEGLTQLREFSRRSIEPGEVRLDIGHVFEWTHLLRLPDYPLWREDIWFSTIPVNIPGIPQPQMMKFIYRVLGFVRVGQRKLAVIDAQGVHEFHEYWEEEDEEELVKYEALGSFSIAARYMFDYEQGMVFGIERPRLIDFDTLSLFPGSLEMRMWELKYPGLVANIDMKYYTETTEKKPRLREYVEGGTTERGPAEPELDRRHVGLTFIMQTEAE